MPSVATSVADAGTIGCDMTIHELIIWCGALVLVQCNYVLFVP